MSVQTELDNAMSVRLLGNDCIRAGISCARVQRQFGDFHLKILCARITGGLLVLGRELLGKSDRLLFTSAEPDLEQLATVTPHPSAASAAESMLCTCRHIEHMSRQVARYARVRDDWPLDKSLSALRRLMARSRAALSDWIKAGPTPEKDLNGHLGLLRDCEIDVEISPARSGRVWIGKADMSSVLLRSWYLSANAYLEITSIDIVSDLILEAAIDLRLMELTNDLAHQLLDEARHADLISIHLEQLGYSLGCVPVSLKTWALYQSCEDLAERLAAQQVVQEATGLEVSALNVHRMRQAGDSAAGELLVRITADELGHVRLGIKWLNYLAGGHARDVMKRVEERSDAIASVPEIPVIPELRSRAGFPTEWIDDEIQRRGARSLVEIMPDFALA